VRLVGCVLERHFGRVAAAGNQAHRVDQPVRDGGSLGAAAELLGVDDALGGDDQAFGGARQVAVDDVDALDVSIAVDIRLVHVDHGHIREEGGHGQQLLPGEGANDLTRGGVGLGVCAEHDAHGKEGHAHGGGLVAPAQPGVAPLGGA